MTNSAGVLAPTAATMPARAGARLYAGATDEAAMTMLPVRPRTPERSPFPPTVAAAAGTVGAVLFLEPHCARGCPSGRSVTRRRSWTASAGQDADCFSPIYPTTLLKAWHGR